MAAVAAAAVVAVDMAAVAAVAVAVVAVDMAAVAAVAAAVVAVDMAAVAAPVTDRWHGVAVVHGTGLKTPSDVKWPRFTAA
jgi:hypothetical protein